MCGRYANHIARESYRRPLRADRDGNQPYRFVMKDLESFAFAGLWEFARIAESEAHS